MKDEEQKLKSILIEPKNEAENNEKLLFGIDIAESDIALKKKGIKNTESALKIISTGSFFEPAPNMTKADFKARLREWRDDLFETEKLLSKIKLNDFAIRVEPGGLIVIVVGKKRILAFCDIFSDTFEKHKDFVRKLINTAQIKKREVDDYRKSKMLSKMKEEF